jgi:hypothetical protein
VFVATDEIECLDFMRQEFGDCAVCVERSPRVHADRQAIHLDRALPVSNCRTPRRRSIPTLPYSFQPDVVISS